MIGIDFFSRYQIYVWCGLKFIYVELCMKNIWKQEGKRKKRNFLLYSSSNEIKTRVGREIHGSVCVRALVDVYVLQS